MRRILQIIGYFIQLVRKLGSLYQVGVKAAGDLVQIVCQVIRESNTKSPDDISGFLVL